MRTTDLSTTSRPEISTPLAKGATASDSSDFNTFLTLLTAQMRNQDPLKPMDSTEFVAQLASFSAVEQQIETNSKLTELLGMLTDSPTASLTEWLGKEVRREGAANFYGQPIEIDATLHPSTDAARLVVRDDRAEIIYSQQIDPDKNSFTWNGTMQNSAVAPDGRYSFEVESYNGGNLVAANAGSAFDLVIEVRLDQGKTVLVFEDGADLLAEEADAVRNSLS